MKKFFSGIKPFVDKFIGTEVHIFLVALRFRFIINNFHDVWCPTFSLFEERNRDFHLCAFYAPHIELGNVS